MFVCYELGKTEAEVSHWTLADVMRWVAFLKLKNEAEAEAMKRASKRPSAPSGGKVTRTVL